MKPEGIFYFFFTLSSGDYSGVVPIHPSGGQWLAFADQKTMTIDPSATSHFVFSLNGLPPLPAYNQWEVTLVDTSRFDCAEATIH